MNMHPTYRARRLRALAIAAAALALIFAMLYATEREAAILLMRLSMLAVIACGVALYRLEGGVA